MALATILICANIKNDLMKNLGSCKKANDVFNKYDEQFLKSMTRLPENFRKLEIEKNLDKLISDDEQNAMMIAMWNSFLFCFFREKKSELFGTQKLIGAPHGLQIYYKDQHKNTNAIVDTIFVGSVRSNQDKYNILLIDQLNWLN